MEYRVSCHPDEIDFDFVHGFIAESYWAAVLQKLHSKKPWITLCALPG